MVFLVSVIAYKTEETQLSTILITGWWKSGQKDVLHRQPFELLPIGKEP